MVERYAKAVDKVVYEDTWPKIDGFIKSFNETIFAQFVKHDLPIIINEDIRFYNDLTGKKVKDSGFPEWRLNMLEKQLNNAGRNFAFTMKMQRDKFTHNGAGDKGVSNIFRIDFEKSTPVMKLVEKGRDRGEEKFVVGYGRWYSAYWKAVYKILTGFYTESSTTFTMKLMELK